MITSTKVVYNCTHAAAGLARQQTQTSISKPCFRHSNLSQCSSQSARLGDFVLFAAQLQQRRGGSLQVCKAAATEAKTYGTTWQTPPDSYLVLGLAHCFKKNEEGKLEDVFVIEPISANSLEGMAAGAATCFKVVTGILLSDAAKKDKSLLPPELQEGVWCEDYGFRIDACARTWNRPHAQDNLLDIVPLGKTKSNWKFSLAEKRVLNFVNEVSDEDNVKQDLSIDVYGRKEKLEAEASAAEPKAEPEASAAPAAEAEQPKEEEDDELDSLLSG